MAHRHGRSVAGDRSPDRSAFDGRAVKGPPVRPTSRRAAGAIETRAETNANARAVARIALVVTLYLGYGAAIWVLRGAAPVGAGDGATAAAAELSAAGRRVWLSSGCPTCHAIYGLGGHLGPDLTNAARAGREEFVAAAVRSGRPGMPRFDLSPREMERLLAYLRAVASSGDYPPRSTDSPVFGAPS